MLIAVQSHAAGQAGRAKADQVLVGSYSASSEAAFSATPGVAGPACAACAAAAEDGVVRSRMRMVTAAPGCSSWSSRTTHEVTGTWIGAPVGR